MKTKTKTRAELQRQVIELTAQLAGTYHFASKALPKAGDSLMASGVRPLSFGDACARYVHRFTCDHVPAWALKVRACGGYYAPQYASDAEWYKLARFPGEDGISKRSRWCESGAPTWPHGQSLDAPFRKASKP